MPVYYVKIGERKKIKAELETDADIITCSSGSTVHFRIRRSQLAAVEQRAHDAIIVNFFSDDHDGKDGGVPIHDSESMVQVVLRSKHSMSILHDLLNVARVP